MTLLRQLTTFSLCIVLLACGDDDSIPSDAGMDSTVDQGPRCAADPECDDGLFCTGQETCEEGVCRPGVIVLCDDEIECTLNACNEVTDRCEFLAPDRDEDGAGDSACLDVNGEPLGRDCDDNNPARFGGNLEVCDTEGVDEDCDLDTFGEVDSDGDGYQDARCTNSNAAGVVVSQGDDCDDGREDVNPATSEVCDRVDNNCDGSIDEGVVVRVAPDEDRDGFPTNMPRMECPGFAGLVTIDDSTVFDCDDDDATRNPGQVEICDDQDNDCDDNVDEDAQAVDWFADNDGDGFGARSSGVVSSCEPVAGSSLLDTDCDDLRSGRNPRAAEICNGIDDDCNGRADYEISPGNFEDDDGDGSPDIACGLPLGVDCDDRDARTAGGNSESCDGRDNDCDGRIDENADTLQWFYDGDGDGHGTIADIDHPPVTACMPPAGYVGSGGDCNDDEREIHPDAEEICGRSDDDCDGAVDEGVTCECPDGFFDCNGDPVDGCETNIWSDYENCGTCGIACNAAHAIDFCSAGRCFVVGCEDGFEDCNGMDADGCEVTLGTSSHCNDCDDTCGDGSTCDDGRCTCDAGTVECEGRCVDPMTDGRFCGASNSCRGPDMGQFCTDGRVCREGNCACGPSFVECAGVCRDPESDVLSCGSACNVCAGGGNADPTCIERTCGFVCLPGFADCNAVGDDCEVELANNALHCGACNNDCTEPNADGSCFGGVCGAHSCFATHSDCNGNLGMGLDGCETLGMCGAVAQWNYPFGDALADPSVFGPFVAVDGVGGAVVVANASGRLQVHGVTHPLTTSGSVLFRQHATGSDDWRLAVTTSRMDAGPTDVITSRVAVDGPGNVYIAGWVEGGTTLVVNTTSRPITGTCSGFVARIDAGGTVNWVTPVLSTSGCVRVRGLAVSGTRLLITGEFDGPMTLDRLYSPNGGSDGFVAELDSTTGAFSRAFSFGGGSADERPYDIAFGPGEQVVVVGAYSGSLATVGIGAADFLDDGPMGNTSDNAFYARFTLPDTGMPLMPPAVNDRGWIATANSERFVDVESDGARYYASGVFTGPITIGAATVTAIRGVMIGALSLGSTGAGFIWGQGLDGGEVDESHQEQMRFALDSSGGLRLGFSAVSVGTFGPFDVGADVGAFLATLDTLTGQVVNVQAFVPSGADLTISGVGYQAGQTTLVGQFGSAASATGTSYVLADRPLVALGDIDQYLMRLDR